MKPVNSVKQTFNAFEFFNKKVVIIDRENSFALLGKRTIADVIVLSNNPKLYINKLNTVFDIRQLVIDGSVPAWKAKLWKTDCDSLGIAYHDVSEKGAFVMKVQ
jgi:competence protein ComEC